MSIAKRIGVVAGIAALAALHSNLCIAAEEAGAPPSPAAVTQDGARQVPAAAPAKLLGVDPVDLKVLAARRGGADVYNDMQLKGMVAENSAVNVATGGNVISEGSFANASGVPMVVQNSGNNVLIQNATIINLQVK